MNAFDIDEASDDELDRLLADADPLRNMAVDRALDAPVDRLRGSWVELQRKERQRRWTHAAALAASILLVIGVTVAALRHSTRDPKSLATDVPRDPLTIEGPTKIERENPSDQPSPDRTTTSEGMGSEAVSPSPTAITDQPAVAPFPGRRTQRIPEKSKGVETQRRSGPTKQRISPAIKHVVPVRRPVHAPAIVIAHAISRNKPAPVEPTANEGPPESDLWVDWKETMAAEQPDPERIEALVKSLRSDAKRLDAFIASAVELNGIAERQRAVDVVLRALGGNTKVLMTRLEAHPTLGDIAWQLAFDRSADADVLDYVASASNDARRRALAIRCARIGDEGRVEALMTLSQHAVWRGPISAAASQLPLQTQLRLVPSVASSNKSIERQGAAFLLASIEQRQFDEGLARMVMDGYFRQEAIQVLMIRNTAAARKFLEHAVRNSELAPGVYAARAAWSPDLVLVRQWTREVPHDDSIQLVPTRDARPWAA